MTILAAYEWSSNATLIEAVAHLGYLRKEWLTLDPTYGRGVWWKNWRPDRLVTHDLNNLDGVDFRQLPEEDATFDAIAYDPPYVCVGGRTTTGLPDFHDRFGLTEAPRSPADLQDLINAGLKEMVRVLRPRRRGEDGPYLLVKCQDYISSGKLWIGTHHTLSAAIDAGLEPVDRFEHITHPRPQPSNRTRKDGKPSVQVHARRNLSTLFVFRGPK